MKKLARLSLKEIDQQFEVILKSDMSCYVGGQDTPSNLGGAEYYGLYGVHLPYGCYYNPDTDQLGDLGWSEMPDPGSISLSPEEAYSQACALGYEAAFKFYLGIGIAVADVFFLFRGMPGLGPDISNLGTWSEGDEGMPSL